MNAKQALAELKKMGTAQNRKIYARHGVTGPMFGVSYANLEKLKKQIKINHEVAVELWETGIHDAQVLACKVADPQKMTSKQIDKWLKSLSDYAVSCSFGGLIGQTKHLEQKMNKWIRSKDEWTAGAGWSLVGRAAMQAEFSDSQFVPLIDQIQTTIHQSKNRTRHAMNGALISIGSRSDKLSKKAIAAAKKIGKVDVDHGDTSCKTPDAESYILKTLAYNKKKTSKKKTSKKKTAKKKVTKKKTVKR